MRLVPAVALALMWVMTPAETDHQQAVTLSPYSLEISPTSALLNAASSTDD